MEFLTLKATASVSTVASYYLDTNTINEAMFSSFLRFILGTFMQAL